jgi:hypothetical protein
MQLTYSKSGQGWRIYVWWLDWGIRFNISTTKPFLPGKNDTESAKFSSLAQISNITNDQIITTSTSSTHSMTPAKSFWDPKTKISQYLKCVKNTITMHGKTRKFSSFLNESFLVCPCSRLSLSQLQIKPRGFVFHKWNKNWIVRRPVATIRG